MLYEHHETAQNVHMTFVVASCTHICIRCRHTQSSESSLSLKDLYFISPSGLHQIPTEARRRSCHGYQGRNIYRTKYLFAILYRYSKAVRYSKFVTRYFNRYLEGKYRYRYFDILKGGHFHYLHNTCTTIL